MSNLKNNIFLIIDNEQQNQNFDYEYYEDLNKESI